MRLVEVDAGGVAKRDVPFSVPDTARIKVVRDKQGFGVSWMDGYTRVCRAHLSGDQVVVDSIDLDAKEVALDCWFLDTANGPKLVVRSDRYFLEEQVSTWPVKWLREYQVADGRAKLARSLCVEAERVAAFETECSVDSSGHILVWQCIKLRKNAEPAQEPKGMSEMLLAAAEPHLIRSTVWDDANAKWSDALMLPAQPAHLRVDVSNGSCCLVEDASSCTGLGGTEFVLMPTPCAMPLGTWSSEGARGMFSSWRWVASADAWVLARADKQGISYVLVDAKSPGVKQKTHVDLPAFDDFAVLNDGSLFVLRGAVPSIQRINPK